MRILLILYVVVGCISAQTWEFSMSFYSGNDQEQYQKACDSAAVELYKQICAENKIKPDEKVAENLQMLPIFL